MLKLHKVKIKVMDKYISKIIIYKPISIIIIEYKILVYNIINAMINKS